LAPRPGQPTMSHWSFSDASAPLSPRRDHRSLEIRGRQIAASYGMVGTMKPNVFAGRLSFAT
jgi:hypothetical protein